jgi:signal peptidase I
LFHTSQPITTESTEPPPRAKRKGQFIIDFLEVILVSGLLFLGINTVSARVRVESISMEPTLNPGDFVAVNKLSYQLSQIHRGDIIVFRYPPAPDQEPYIKRVIGLPGEIIRIENGKVFVNGALVKENYLKENTMHGGKWQIPEDAVFVMGDNRNNSSDSRVWGMVPLENIIGKGVFVYWPPDKWGQLNSRYVTAAEP